jgi:hypothetical protein
MAWVSKTVRLTNRAARVLRGGPAELPSRELADVISSLCNHYWDLLLDPGFRSDIEQSQRQQSKHLAVITGAVTNEFRCHVNEAISLLAEAGVDGELAVEALRVLENEMGRPGAQLETVNTENFFKQLRVVKKTVCALKATVVSKAEAEASTHSLRRMTLAGIGLTLTGLVGGGLALAAAPAAGAIAIGTAASAAVLSAIGNTIFQHYTAPRP